MTNQLISLLIPSFRGGGAEGAVVRLANQLAQLGRQVEIVTLSDEGPWKSVLDPQISKVNLAAPRALLSLPKLRGYLLEQRPAMLVSNLPHLSALSVIARGISGANTRLLILEHNDLEARLAWEPGMRVRLLSAAMKVTYPKADRILAVSQGVAESLVSRLGLPPNLVGVLPNGLDVAHIRQMAAESAPHPWLEDRDRPIFLGAGRLVRQKGFDLLLKSFKMLLDDLPSRLILLGTGPEKENLEDLANELGISEAVDLPGFKRNPYAFMRAAEAFVLSSRFEGFGVVLLEALAVGCPIVAFDCPSGPAEVLGEGDYGLLVPPGDIAGLAHRMMTLVAEPELADELRGRGPGRAEHYDIRRVAGKFLEELDRLVDR